MESGAEARQKIIILQGNYIFIIAQLAVICFNNCLVGSYKKINACFELDTIFISSIIYY